MNEKGRRKKESTPGENLAKQIIEQYQPKSVEAVSYTHLTILLDQWKHKRGRIPSLIGLGATAVCLVLFSRENFILVALVVILAALTLLRPRLDPQNEEGVI